MTEPLFDTIAVVGLGLIGSSVARGVKARGLARRVVGYDSSTQVHNRAKELGFCDSVANTPSEAVKDAELVLIAVPVGATADAVKSVAPHLRQGVIVTEVGSVKAAVIRQVLAVLPSQAVFVPGHPIAGTEHSGPDAGFAELFEGRWAILTPCERSSEAAVAKVAALWRGLGSAVETMTPEHHDIVLAITSHIPHLIAFNIVGTAADVEEVTQS
ncbi:MAG: prephenate dehydrogenase/arogenate dehydrogenase family protein, partial [Methyloceanibacter sp.]